MTVIEQNGIFGGEENKGIRMDHMAITAAPLTFLYIIKKDVKFRELSQRITDPFIGLSRDL